MVKEKKAKSSPETFLDQASKISYETARRQTSQPSGGNFIAREFHCLFLRTASGFSYQKIYRLGNNLSGFPETACV